MRTPKIIDIPTDGGFLRGQLQLPDQPKGLIVFSYGSRNSRLNPRNRFIAKKLLQEDFATLLFDLFTPQEYFEDKREERFNLEFSTRRLIEVTEWLKKQPDTARFPIGYFGSGAGAASAITAAADLGPQTVKAVVCRSGRLDLLKDKLDFVQSPTLLLVGSLDSQNILAFNENAFKRLKGTKELQIISGASHFFEKPDKLEELIQFARNWFLKYLHFQETEMDKDFIP